METYPLLLYFAAHAPVPPNDFPREKVQRIVSEGATRRWVWIDESALEWTVRWRWKYAAAMVNHWTKVNGTENQTQRS